MLSKGKIKEQARLLVSEIAKVKGPVNYQDALELMAKLHGFRNWKTMSASAQAAPAPADEVDTRQAEYAGHLVVQTAEGYFEQGELPGVGYLYRVPVCVDATMSTVVLVRARDRGEAIDTARTLVSEGKARMEVDEGNYRGRADYYCPDSSDDAVFRVQEPTPVVASSVQDGYQSGRFLVELCDLGDGDGSLLWADLTVFDPEQEEGDPFSVMSCVEVEASPEERAAFCRQVTELLSKYAPGDDKLDHRTVEHAFTRLAQGGLTMYSEADIRHLFNG